MNPEKVNIIEKNRIEEIAQIRLASLGLSLDDLRKYGLVLDIGAKDCIIQRAAENREIDSVISVDKKFSEGIKQLGLKILENDAKSIKIPDSSVDLALVRSSAYYYTNTEEETRTILREINRCLKRTGVQRVYPARFGHITARLLSTNKDYYNAKSKSPEFRNRHDIKLIEENDNLALIETIEFLNSVGIPAKSKEGIEPNAASNFKFYLDIVKF